MTSSAVRKHPIVAALRASLSKADTFLGGLGIFLVAGIAVAGIATWFFGEISETVMAGETQAFDDAVLKFLAAHRTKLLDGAMLEITAMMK